MTIVWSGSGSLMVEAIRVLDKFAQWLSEDTLLCLARETKKVHGLAQIAEATDGNRTIHLYDNFSLFILCVG